MVRRLVSDVLPLQQAVTNSDRKDQHDAVVLRRQMIHLVNQDLLDLHRPPLQTRNYAEKHDKTPVRKVRRRTNLESGSSRIQI